MASLDDIMNSTYLVKRQVSTGQPKQLYIPLYIRRRMNEALAQATAMTEETITVPVIEPAVVLFRPPTNASGVSPPWQIAPTVKSSA